MKRQRGRGRKPGGGGGGSGGNHGNRPHESNGPDVKIRGTAAQIYEKYMQYARDSHSSGDRVRYESYLQHAEHYFRIMAATMPRDRMQAVADGNGSNHGGADDRDIEDLPVDGLKVMDDASDDDGVEAAVPGHAVGAREEEFEEFEGSGEDRGDDQARGRRRRGRRRRPEGGQQGERGAAGPASSGGSGATGGGDTEARSALDALAQRQAAVAGG